VEKTVLSVIMLDSAEEGFFGALPEGTDKYIFHRRQNK
jgi:hypothetical protein